MSKLHQIVRAAAVAIVAAGLTIGLALSGVPQLLGAHPWWALTTAVTGAAAGALVATLFAFVPGKPFRRLMLFGLLVIVAFLTARQGGELFALSYAENALAGRVWYFGWIAVSATTTLLLTQIYYCGTKLTRMRDAEHNRSGTDVAQ